MHLLNLANTGLQVRAFLVLMEQAVEMHQVPTISVDAFHLWELLTLLIA